MEEKDLKWILSAISKENHRIPILETGLTRGDVIDITWYNHSGLKLRHKPNRLGIRDFIKLLATKTEL